jgi:O-antigen ligase
MFAIWYYKNRFAFASILFFVFGALAIFNNEFLFIAIPFAWILIPAMFNYAVAFTEQLFWLLIFLLPLSTELQVTSSLSLDFPDEIIMMLLTGIVIIKLIHQPKLFPSYLPKQSLFLLLVIHLVWIFICCIFSVNVLVSFKFLLAKTWYVIPFVLLPQIILKEKTDIKKLACCLFIPMVLVAAQSIIRHSFYSFSFEFVKRIYYPFFRNHVNFSAMLVCIIAIIWACRKLTIKKKWINIALVICVAALFFSYSRGAWLALIVGFTGGFIIHKKLLKQTLIIAAIIFIGFAAWLKTNNNYLKFTPDFQHTIFHTNFSEHLNATVTLKDVSNAERFYRWAAGIKMIEQKPITGFGPNNFYDNYKQTAINSFKTWVSNNPDHSSVHNYFLLTTIEQGFIGVIIFTTLFVVMLLQTQKLYHQFTDEFYKTVALTTAIILLMIGTVIFLSDLIETDKIGSLYWLCLGIILFLQGKISSQSPFFSINA